MGWLDSLFFEAGAFYLMDRGYMDFIRLALIARAGAFFVARAKTNLQFSRHHSQMTLTEVAVLTRLTPATARRSLHTLERLGYLTRCGRRFCLRPRVLALGAGYLHAVKAEVVLQPYVDEMVELHGGCAAVAILDDLHIVCVAHASARRPLRVVPGVRSPAYATSLGRVLLAHRPEFRIQVYLRRAAKTDLSAFADTDPSVVIPLLAAVRRKAFAIVENELNAGLMSIAVPVRAPSGRVIAAACCADSVGNLGRLELLEERLPTLRTTVASIEQALLTHPELAVSADAGEDWADGSAETAAAAAMPVPADVSLAHGSAVRES